MTQSLTHPVGQSSSTAQPVAPAAARPSTSTRRLLTIGLLTGPLFIGLAGIQVLTRPGFDLRRDAISLLTLGDLGWIQVANFVASGLLALLLAAGMRRAMHPGRGSTWGPLLIGGYGIGFLIGGIFTPDPSFGFPPGAPEGMPAVMSWHGSLHAVGFMLAFLSVIPACFVFVRRYVERKQGREAIYSAASGIVAPALIVLGSSNLSIGGVLFFLAGVVVCSWLVVVSLGLLAETKRLPA